MREWGCSSGSGGGGLGGGGLGGQFAERVHCLVLLVEFLQPVGKGLSVVVGEGRVDKCQREELPALIEVVVHLAGAQEDFGEQLHVFLAGLCVPWVEKG